jgi:hypothetical protein
VTGELRSLTGEVGPVAAVASAERPETSTRAALSLAFGWFVVLILIGIGVLVFAGSYLDRVVDTLEASFWRSLAVGIGAQLAFVPALVLVVIALALTIIGILLIPFAVVAFTLGTIGLLTLGFLGVARLTGQSLGSARTRRLSARGAALRSVFVGIAAYMLLWIVAAALTWIPIVSIGIKMVAFAVTWVAATAGLGATVLSRAGTRGAEQTRTTEEREVEALAWQTPTPITGVVAARRPTAAGGAGKR